MTEETADLFIQHEEERDHSYEEMAAKYEITVDYYIAEFLQLSAPLIRLISSTDQRKSGFVSPRTTGTLVIGYCMFIGG